MADRMELLLEAERRGILPPEKSALLAEARKRGLVSGEAPQPKALQDPLNKAQHMDPSTFPAQLGNAAIRMGLKGVSALPLMAMDLGVATRNVGENIFDRLTNKPKFSELITGPQQPRQEYELPSAMFNRELDRLTTPPAHLAGKIAEFGGSTVAGGLIPGPQAANTNKVLDEAAKRVFSSSRNELSSPQRAAASFAKQKGVPAPLSSLAPGSTGSKVQQASRGLLLGDIKTQRDANKVAQFLNREVSTITSGARPVDEAAMKGQQYLRSLFAPGEKIYKETWQKFRDFIGIDARIPTTKSMETSARVLKSLEGRGETRLIHGRIKDILNAKGETLSVREFDNLYGGLISDMKKNPAATPEVGAMLSAIRDDLDNFASPLGFEIKEALVKAETVRKGFRELKDVPALHKLSKEIGEGGERGTRLWMAKLFGSPNGKALAEFRAKNPDLYHELADSWVAMNISRFSRHKDSAVMPVLDGQGLRSWFTQNAANLKVILGAERAKALDNFSNYASHMAGAQQRALTGKSFDPLTVMARGSAEIGGSMIASPLVAGFGEPASYVLARGLSDPDSALFQLFTEGVRPGTIEALKRMSATGAVLATQEND